MKKIIRVIYKWVTVTFPRSEVIIRKLYWKNYKLLKKYNPHGGTPDSEQPTVKVDFEKIIDRLKNAGIGAGSLVLIHSSYSGLACTGLSEDEIIDRLLTLVGPTGTIAMPVIRKFKGDPKDEDCLTTNTDDIVCTYDVKKTRVTSGLLPYALMRRSDAVISHCPLNPICAVGPLAKDMMAHELDDFQLTPHGKNSAWKYCYDKNAFYISLGIDLDRHCTLVHAAEEAFDDWRWSKEEWFRERIFDIIDEQGKKERRIVLERKPEWGMIYIAEMKMAHDLLKNKIIDKTYIDDTVEVCISRATSVVDYMRSKNKNGYPYYR